jgi:hypothetical protein
VRPPRDESARTAFSATAPAPSAITADPAETAPPRPAPPSIKLMVLGAAVTIAVGVGGILAYASTRPTATAIVPPEATAIHASAPPVTSALPVTEVTPVNVAPVVSTAPSASADPETKRVAPPPHLAPDPSSAHHAPTVAPPAPTPTPPPAPTPPPPVAPTAPPQPVDPLGTRH